MLSRDGAQSMVFYRVLPTRQALDTATAERRLTPRRSGNTAAALPVVVVTDEPVSSRTADERRLLLRLATPAVHKVRAGRGNRSIELVFAGLVLLVQPVPAAELPPDAVGRFRVTLEASDQPGALLSAAIPSSLQAVNVFTTSRVVQGRLLHETHLGLFARRSEAEVLALAAVRKRFPKAEVSSDDAPASALARCRLRRRHWPAPQRPAPPRRRGMWPPPLRQALPPAPPAQPVPPLPTRPRPAAPWTNAPQP